MVKWDLSQGCKNGLFSINQSMWYTILANQRIKPYDHLNEKARQKFNIHLWFKKKTLNKVGTEGAYNIIKAINNKPTANIILNNKKLKSFPLKIKNKTRMPILIFIQRSIKSHSHSNRANKINKWLPNWKERSKTVTVCTWHDTKILKMPPKICLNSSLNSIKLQYIKWIYRNLLCLYTLTMKYQKEKLRNDSIYSYVKKKPNPLNEVPWWLNGIKIQNCHFYGTGYCYGAGLIPGSLTPACHWHSKTKQNKIKPRIN